MKNNNKSGFYSPELNKWVVTTKDNITQHQDGHNLIIDVEQAKQFDTSVEMKKELYQE
jgi:S-formylglutathione hydrolase FrmB